MLFAFGLAVVGKSHPAPVVGGFRQSGAGGALGWSYDRALMRPLLILCVWAFAGAAVAAQAELQPVAPPSGVAPQESVPKLTDQQRVEATKLLARYAEQSQGVEVLVADYIQRRTTTLSKKPLLSSGGFVFVRDPACVVFRANMPRQSVVRLTSKIYEVFRPRRKRLERFSMGGLDLAQGLFAAVGGDAKQLLKDFNILAFSSTDSKTGPKTEPEQAESSTPSIATIRLVPKNKLMRERLRELLIQLHVTAASESEVALRSVSYRDQSGDLVEIELAKVRKNPKDPPPAKINVPSDTRILDHKVRR